MTTSTGFLLKNSFYPAINLGLVPGLSTASMTGYNPSVGTTEETLWPFGGIYVWPDRAGEPMGLLSDNAADNQPILIRGLDGDGLPIQDVVVLNGTTPVSTNLTFGRVNLMLNAGATETQGVVIIRGAGGGPTYSGIQPEDQRSLQLIYTLPINRTGFFLPSESTINRSANQDTDVRLGTMVRRPGGVFWRVGRWGLEKRGASSFLFQTEDTPALTPGDDLEIRAVSSSSDTDVSGRVPFLLSDTLERT